LRGSSLWITDHYSLRRFVREQTTAAADLVGRNSDNLGTKRRAIASSSVECGVRTRLSEHTDHATKTSIRSAHEQFRPRTRSLRRKHIKDVVIFITHQSLGNLCSPEFVRKLEDPERMEPWRSPSTSSKGTARSVYCTPHPIRHHKLCGIGVCLASSAIL
jgi:hypothetical protein